MKWKWTYNFHIESYLRSASSAPIVPDICSRWIPVKQCDSIGGIISLWRSFKNFHNHCSTDLFYQSASLASQWVVTICKYWSHKNINTNTDLICDSIAAYWTNKENKNIKNTKKKISFNFLGDSGDNVCY